MFLLVLNLLLTTQLQSQNKSKFQYKFSHQIESEIEDGSLRKSSASYHYSYIGEYKKSLETYELQLDFGLDSMTNSQAQAFEAYKPVNAFDYIKDQVKNHKLVIVSEAHQKPQHRVFTRKLLKDLYNKGFRHLGVETLTPHFQDTTKFLMDYNIEKRGYPTTNQLTGTYTREPQMGNMIREAISLGFKIFAYEKTIQKTERDYQQALNIDKYMRQFPFDKFLVHCGWYHAIESDYPKRRKDNYMAFHLKKLSGTDPLTIYQDALTEKELIPESPFYENIKSDSISVLVNDEGSVFNGIDGTNHFDIFVYHPETKFKNGRPHWLYDIEGNNTTPILKAKLKTEDYPVIVKAFKYTDDINATPVDMVELKNEKDNKVLVLNEGAFKIIITNESDIEYVYYIKNKPKE